MFIVQRLNVLQFEQYANDTQIYTDVTASDAAAELSRLSSCLSALHNWFCQVAVSSSKSEFILFGSRQRLHNIQ